MFRPGARFSMNTDECISCVSSQSADPDFLPTLLEVEAKASNMRSMRSASEQHPGYLSSLFEWVGLYSIDVQGLLLSLHSGTTPGGAPGVIWGAQNQTPSLLPSGTCSLCTVLLLQSHPQSTLPTCCLFLLKKWPNNSSV